MSKFNSPLRYPGGKTVLAGFLADIVSTNDLQDGVYIEPYAGGAGIALHLLFGEYVHRVVINDADPHIYAFWFAAINHTEELIKRIEDVPVTIEEWWRQREIYHDEESHSLIETAFATFFLNRCNRSGIIANAGPIGGKKQAGKWKIDARFNKSELIRRIKKISYYRERIELHNLDAIELLRRVLNQQEEYERTLIYLDPPYYAKGKLLYLNYYEHDDHAKLAAFLETIDTIKWVATYDDVPEIRSLYQSCHCTPFQLSYKAHARKKGNELLIYKDLQIPYAL